MNQTRNWIFLALAVFIVTAIVILTKPGDQSSLPSGTETEESPTITPMTSKALLDQIKAKGAPVTVLNLWASFCLPCRDEFPFFLRAYREYQDEGLNLMFVTMDFKSDLAEARSFLVEQGVDFETFIKDERDEDFINGLHPEWSGVIPATLIFDAKGELKYFVSRPLTFEELEEKILEVLNRK